MIRLGQTAFDYIHDTNEWVTSGKFDEQTQARLQVYKYKDIRSLIYAVSSKLKHTTSHDDHFLRHKSYNK